MVLLTASRHCHDEGTSGEAVQEADAPVRLAVQFPRTISGFTWVTFSPASHCCCTNGSIVDAEIIQDAWRFKMDLVAGLKRTLQGDVKPSLSHFESQERSSLMDTVITQCSMRHLYNAEPKNAALIEQAKTYERRRCNHHTLENPLSTMDCLKEVVDGKGNHTNKHRYVVASQDGDIRAFMRQIPGVPLIYINRSVMILEPMANSTEKVKMKEDKDKFRAGLKGSRGGQVLGKRTRDSEEPRDGIGEDDKQPDELKKKKQRGPKGPNPLSVKKSKKKSQDVSARPAAVSLAENTDASKRKRKRKKKPVDEDGHVDAELITVDST